MLLDWSAAVSRDLGQKIHEMSHGEPSHADPILIFLSAESI